jgi:hypothetical protein
MIMLAALALVMAGCMGNKAGSNSTADTTTSSTTTTAAPRPVTHRQFVKRLDRLCGQYGRKVDRLNKRYADVYASGDYAAIADAYGQGKKLDAPWRSALGSLKVPPKDERRFRRYVALVYRIEGLFDREIRAYRHHDDAEIARFEGLITQARNQRTNLAVDMGLQVCGS